MENVCQNHYIERTSIFDGIRLFCFPYAGAGASVFKTWREMFEYIKVYPLQYPGRENRIMERPIPDIKILVDEIYDELKYSIQECPFIMFGHSLGTKLVYELSLKIYNEKKIWPKGVIVSGGRAPNLIEPNPIYSLDDESFIRELVKRYSSIPNEIANNKEMMSLFLPALRADFIMDEKYIKNKVDKIDCPIMGLIGTEDSEMTFDDLNKWSDFTMKEFSYKYIEGDHMFINKNGNEVIAAIKKFVKKLK
ncbi:MAG: thioesterase domain-containing protein [Clostridium sp.]|jgi:surfactin synthase thioesterase subunit|uniref:thioesterase II family protein n=1 Tax=Clostridium sp. TaxID=1506 RepID=UPI0025C0DBD7|nr:thioesterase domain-containing protein [Clostridium sp.]MCH3963491.1 thioesterase domain-containing protein [Clostridium sp.]MCI1714632.1 thioesterase domain-containing protein [Clostridium sp.]MCI1799179.1 thioesterase domain-containing protein [Clostridium sp.]MCI1812815.1 thioesterase domain-containing protein [Clostridium sp.]MCI1869705.1 thioesterase domain-containing protein [Clostridium sp.]